MNSSQNPRPRDWFSDWEIMRNASVRIEHKASALLNCLDALVTQQAKYAAPGQCDGKERHGEYSDCLYCIASRLTRQLHQDRLTLAYGPGFAAKGEA